MPRFGPIKRRSLIQSLRRAGYKGPESGGRHQLMRRGQHTIAIPNPHDGDIGINLLKEILRQAEIDRREWEKL